MPEWTSWIQVGANVAAILGLVGVVLAYRQLHAGLRGQREATAIGIWKDYLHLALQHPTLAAPREFLTTSSRGTEEFERYEWFVSAMLFACEQIVALSPDDRAWRDTVLSQLRYHKRYLGGNYFEIAHYSPVLQGLIRQVTSEAGPARGSPG